MNKEDKILEEEKEKKNVKTFNDVDFEFGSLTIASPKKLTVEDLIVVKMEFNKNMEMLL